MKRGKIVQEVAEVKWEKSEKTQEKGIYDRDSQIDDVCVWER